MSATNYAKKYLMMGGFNLPGDTVKVMLLNNQYTLDIDNHYRIADVDEYEVSGTGYTAGGETLANKSIIQDNTNDRAYFDADDVQWDNVTLSNVRYVCIYKSTGSPGDSYILCIINFGANYSPSGNNFKIIWNENGIFRIK